MEGLMERDGRTDERWAFTIWRCSTTVRTADRLVVVTAAENGHNEGQHLGSAHTAVNMKSRVTLWTRLCSGGGAWDLGSQREACLRAVSRQNTILQAEDTWINYSESTPSECSQQWPLLCNWSVTNNKPLEYRTIVQQHPPNLHVHNSTNTQP